MKTVKQFKIFILSLFMLLFLNKEVTANEFKEEILAVVNQNIVTNYDLDQKIKLLSYMGSIPSGIEINKDIKEQILLMIVNELIANELIEEHRLEVHNSEINNHLEMVVSQDNSSLEDLKADLKTNGIDFETMQNHLRAQMLWQRYISYVLMPEVKITEEEIQKFIESSGGSNEKKRTKVKIAEIVIRNDNPEAIKTVESIEKMLAEQTADFGKIAVEFSQSVTADSSGEIGWIFLDNLSENLQNSISSLNKGQITKPLKIGESFHIIKLLDTKTTTGSLENNNETKEQVRNYLTQKTLDSLAKSVVHQKRISSIISIAK